MIPYQESLPTLALAGTPKEIKAQLEKSDAETVLVLEFAHIEQAVVQRLRDNLGEIIRICLAAPDAHQEKAVLNNLVAAVLPRKPATPPDLKELRMLAAAQRAILESGDWLTAAEVAGLAGLSERNPSAQPNKWKNAGQIFAISHKGHDYFPKYALDWDAGFRPSKSLAKIIAVFSAHKGAWGMAYWFDSPNSYLGGKRPKELLGAQPDQVIEAARNEVQAVSHG